MLASVLIKATESKPPNVNCKFTKNRKENMLKKIVLSFIIIALGIFGFIVWGLYLMEIEDHYGNLQETYFDSKSGDLIVNKKTKKFGFIIKSWKRANVITNENDTLDLYNLINVNGKKCDYEVFRSDTKLNIQELSFEKIMELKDKNSIQTVINNVNEK